MTSAERARNVVVDLTSFGLRFRLASDPKVFGAIVQNEIDAAVAEALAARWVPVGERLPEVGVTRAYRWGQCDHDADAGKDQLSRLCNEGEEWVELDAAGQPVEAAKAVADPKRLFAMRSPSGLYHMGCGDWTEHIARALTYGAQLKPLDLENVMVPVLVHPDGTVTLDEPAPAVAQPSPYSEDEPIPYKLTEPDKAERDKTKRDRLIAEVAVHYAKASRHVRMASKKSRKLERLDEAAARLRGGK